MVPQSFFLIRPIKINSKSFIWWFILDIASFKRPHSYAFVLWPVSFFSFFLALRRPILWEKGSAFDLQRCCAWMQVGGVWKGFLFIFSWSRNPMAHQHLSCFTTPKIHIEFSEKDPNRHRCSIYREYECKFISLLSLAYCAFPLSVTSMSKSIV